MSGRGIGEPNDEMRKERECLALSTGSSERFRVQSYGWLYASHFSFNSVFMSITSLPRTQVLLIIIALIRGLAFQLQVS